MMGTSERRRATRSTWRTSRTTETTGSADLSSIVETPGDRALPASTESAGASPPTGVAGCPRTVSPDGSAPLTPGNRARVEQVARRYPALAAAVDTRVTKLLTAVLPAPDGAIATDARSRPSQGPWKLHGNPREPGTR